MVALADLPATIDIDNDLTEPLVLAGGYIRLEALEVAKTITLTGLSDSQKSQVWIALYNAEQNLQIDAGGITALTDPIEGEHLLVGGQDVIGETDVDVEPFPPLAVVVSEATGNEIAVLNLLTAVTVEEDDALNDRGSPTALRLRETTADSEHHAVALDDFVSSDADHAIDVIAKADGRNRIRISTSGLPVETVVVFDLVAKAVVSASVGTTVTFLDLGRGWIQIRCEFDTDEDTNPWQVRVGGDIDGDGSYVGEVDKGLLISSVSVSTAAP